MDNPTTQAGAFIATCPFCGSEFKPKRKGKDRRGNPRYQKYCSSDCYRRHKDVQPLVKAICRGCGAKFHARKDRTTYCSRECAFEHRQHRCTQCDAPMRGRKLDRFCSELCRIASSVRLCTVCGGQFEAIPNQMICSRECQLAVERRRYREAYAKQRPLKELVCKECGGTFTTKYNRWHGDKRREYCSKECSNRRLRRIAKARRRARKRGTLFTEEVDRFKVFQRDKWTCQRCGCETPCHLSGTIEPNAPQLDHIIPLALGGPHTYNNVQCLCRACNIAKADSYSGQLRFA